MELLLHLLFWGLVGGIGGLIIFVTLANIQK